jgi:hypothetical protein
MKEIKSIRESAAELRLILERVKAKYDIRRKTLNLCSDRCSMNEAAFRLRGLDYSSLFDRPYGFLVRVTLSTAFSPFSLTKSVAA